MVLWTLVATLFACSAYFAVGAEAHRRSVQLAKGDVATDDIVELVQVVDGDTVLVRAPSGENVTVRIIGVKSFDRTSGDETAAYGQKAEDELTRLLQGRPARIQLNDPPRDAHGRTLAALFVDEEDVGLTLVRSGATLVYTAHPFPSMTVYLQEQSASASARRGLWANDKARARAEALGREWSARSR